jgi:tRNA (guanine-N7-)-methyltransferase
MQHTIKTFARRLSRGLRPTQQHLVDTLLPQLDIRNNPIKLMQYVKVVLEIGFGNGDFITNMAEQGSETLFVGAEPFLNGVSSLLAKIHANSIHNIMICPDDVMSLLEIVPQSSFDAIYIICPDPWPKKRHHKRRLVQRGFLGKLLGYLKPKGVIEIVTDHPDYATWIRDQLNGFNFSIVSPPDDWYYTKYQKRGMNLGYELTRFVVRQLG